MGKGGKRDKKERRDKEKSHKNKKNNHYDMANNKRKGRGKGKTKQDKNWNKYFNEFQEVLKPKGIYMRDVEGDGNCLFRSVADHVDGDENDFQKYRNMAVEYITKNKEYFALFLLDDEKIEEYIKDMSEDGTWGGHFELVALSSLLNVKFVLHIKEGDPVVVKSSERDLKGVRFVHLAYHIDEHYSSVRKIGDEDKAPAQPIPFDDSSDSESNSDADSTEESDRDMATVTKEVEKMSLSKKERKLKKREQEEVKEEEHDYYGGKGKHQKTREKKEKEKEEKGKNKKRGK